jgi:hypothetical protein
MKRSVVELNGKKVPFHRLKEDTSSLIDLENVRKELIHFRKKPLVTTLHQGSFINNEAF